MEHYDVIIIGAGPAGLKCAEILDGSELKVLLLEKNEIIGPKVCAGGLTALNTLLNLPAECLSFEKQKIILNNSKYDINLVNPVKIISRFDLGQSQLNEVKKFSNIVFRKRVKVEKIHNEFILTDKGEKIYFKKLVGADGSSSITRSFLKLENKIYIGIQYIIPKTHYEFVFFLNSKLLKTGYGWIFPHKKFTSAGVYFNPKLISPKKAKSALDKLLNKYGLDFTGAKLEGALANTLFKGLKFGNVFLAGDAAGLASANTGEGISYAIASGYDIGRHILDKFYKFDKIKEIIKYKKRQEFILKTFDKFPIPFVQTLMFKIFIKLMKQPKFQKFYGI